jgi:hypothetical protein
MNLVYIFSCYFYNTHFYNISHLGLGLPNDLFHSHFRTKYITSPLSHMCYISYLIFLDLIMPLIFGQECKLWSSLLCNFLHPPVNSFLLGTNNLLSTLFSNTLNLCSSLNMKHQVSRLHKTTGNTETQVTYSHRVSNCRPKNSFKQNLLLWLGPINYKDVTCHMPKYNCLSDTNDRKVITYVNILLITLQTADQHILRILLSLYSFKVQCHF